MGQNRGVTLFSSKRAISPLIATVMLIAFAVALGAVVMNWGKGFLEESGAMPEGGETNLEGPDPCQQMIQLQFLTIAGRPDICFDQLRGTINYRFENNGQVPIEGGKMQVIGASDVLEFDIEPVPVAGIKKGANAYDPARYGQVQKAKVVPKIKGQLCPQKALTVETIPTCS